MVGTIFTFLLRIVSTKHTNSSKIQAQYILLREQVQEEPAHSKSKQHSQTRSKVRAKTSQDNLPQVVILVSLSLATVKTREVPTET